MLLAYAKDMDLWHKHWGNAAFTIELSDEKSAQGVKTKCIQMVQTHGSVQFLRDGVPISLLTWIFSDVRGNSCLCSIA
jgi:hypothetical protein